MSNDDFSISRHKRSDKIKPLSDFVLIDKIYLIELTVVFLQSKNR